MIFALQGVVLTGGTCGGANSSHLWAPPLWRSRSPFVRSSRRYRWLVSSMSLLRKVTPDPLSAFLKGLSETGYEDGRNMAIEYRWAEGDADRLPGLTAELVRRGSKRDRSNDHASSPHPAKAATTTIRSSLKRPPIRSALASSPALTVRAANVTGVTQTNVELAPKRLELLHDLSPTTSVMALLVNPANPTLAEANTKELQTAALAPSRWELHVLNASDEREFDGVFAKLVQLRAGGLRDWQRSILYWPERSARRAWQSATRCLRPYAWREFAVAGGLLSYGRPLRIHTDWRATIPAAFSRARARRPAGPAD